jgi:hypothetical protein
MALVFRIDADPVQDELLQLHRHREKSRQRGGQPVGVARLPAQVRRCRKPGMGGEHRIADLQRVVPRQARDVAAEDLVVGTIEPRRGLALCPRPVHVRQVAVMEQVQEVRERRVVVVLAAVAHHSV